MHHIRLLCLLLALVLGASACGGGEPPGAGEDAVDPTVDAGAGAGAPASELAPPDADPTAEVGADPTVGATAGPTADAAARPTAAATPDATGDGAADLQPSAGDPSQAAVALEEVAVLDRPIAAASRLGDDRLWIAERAGTVRPLSMDGEVGAPVIDLRDQTTTDGERGLLGLAWASDGQTLYLSSTDQDGTTVLQAADVSEGVLQAPREVLRVPQPASNHNGGDVHIGPDGMLWWALGDGGAADDRFGNGQRPDTLLGTLLRLDTSAAPYAIPADNPFAAGGDGAPEVWAYGLRNPWRFSFDDLTGDLWVADVGQNAVEEVNRVPADAAGLNYGWPRFEGDRSFDGQPLDGEHQEPVHTYGHDRGCSITGGVVYRGEAIPELLGAYLYSDFCNGDLHALQLTDDGLVAQDVQLGASADQVVSFGIWPSGEVAVLSLAGPVMTIVPAGS